jgi:hypothetical protein
MTTVFLTTTLYGFSEVGRPATRDAVAPGYPLQSFCPCCFGLEGKKDLRYYPWPMLLRKLPDN